MQVSEDDFVECMACMQAALERAGAAEREVARLRAENAELRLEIAESDEIDAAIREDRAAVLPPVEKPFDGSTPLINTRARAYSTEQVG